MGFSVSASVAIIFAALLIAFGMFHGAAYDTVERVTDARSAAQDDRLAQQNTAIEITRAVHFGVNDTLLVDVNNTGARTLGVEKTDLLVDGEYQIDFAERDVNGDTGTALWQPGERLRYNVSLLSQPDRVKVVSGPGVADAEVVTSG